MKYSLLLLFTLIFFQVGNSQPLEQIENGLKKARNQLMALIPNSVDINEGYYGNAKLEWPSGKTARINEKIDVFLKYDFGGNKPLSLKMGLDANGDISASIKDLLEIFGIDWKFGGTIEFDSNGNLKTAKYYYDYMKSSIAEYWN